MPTKAGRIRIEDIRVGRVIYDLGINWDTFSAFARPLKIVAKAPNGYNCGRDIMFTTLEPEGNYHCFHSRRNITQCGFYGTFDQSRPDSEILERNASPINFFANKRAAERYMDRMRADGTYPWERPAQFEAYGYKPAKPLPVPKNIGPAAIKEVEGIWATLQAHSPDRYGVSYSQEELAEKIDEFIQRTLKTPAYGIKLLESKVAADGSIAMSLTGPPELIARVRAAQEQAAAKAQEPDRDYVNIWAPNTVTSENLDRAPTPEEVKSTTFLVEAIRETAYQMYKDSGYKSMADTGLHEGTDGIKPPPEGEGSMSDQTGQAGERAIVDVKANPDGAV